ncbi:hypothetical protein [Pseudomonas sp.]|uniref:hypothetical protein n=1 Tax=Pseudomonas sp. TaxID=306 RepID=UPI00258E6A19|nr:hypothetical protein [Pseudomonas sp.]
MAHRKLKDLAVKVGEYESQGEKKSRWHNVGALMDDGNGGQYLMLDRYFNPAGVPNPEGRASLLVSMFDPKDNRTAAPATQQQRAPAQRPTPQQPRPQAPPQQRPPNKDDDVPF